MTNPEVRSRELAEQATPGPWLRGTWGAQAERMCDCAAKGALLGKRKQNEYPGAGPFHVHETDFYPDEHRLSGPAPECVSVADNYDYEEGGIVEERDAAYIAFHDPALIKAYADVVEAAREMVASGHTTDDDGLLIQPDDEVVVNGKTFDAAALALTRLDALTEEREG